MTFFEKELHRLFDDSERISADVVFAGKTMIAPIGKDLRAKVQFVNTSVSGNYDALRLTIINRHKGAVDSETFKFKDIIGMKGDYAPHIWETILCNDTEIDAEKFCTEKSAIFIIMPEEDSSKYFMVSLIIQQLYREILAVADENGGKLKNRVVFYCDEFGTLPKIESAEMMFSASRSRRVSIVPIIQSLAQLEKNYGKEGAEIIVDNTQLTVFGGFAPNSETAQVLSKSLGTRTVMSGSVSQSKNDPSRSLQMIERPLMTADELKSLPKGTFVVTKTGFNPIKVKLKLFFKWGIQFKDQPYVVPLRDNKDICYANKDALMRAVYDKYTTDKKDPDNEIPDGSYSVSQILGENNYPTSNRSARQHHAAKLSDTPPPEETT